VCAVERRMGCANNKAAAPKTAGGTPSSQETSKKSPTKDATRTNNIQPVKARFIFEHRDKITDYYETDQKSLGQGSYGSVAKAVRKQTGQMVAIKTIKKNDVKNLPRFKLEIHIMKVLDHANIIKLYENFEDHKNIYLVMELCTGGELFDRIIEEEKMTEKHASIIMRQMLRAINYMHGCHIMHRDLKPENFLFRSKDPVEKTDLKIIDFGLSCEFTPGQTVSTRAGTPYYVAPQVLGGDYDQACDLWSCGVMLFIILVGYPPFWAENDADVLKKVSQGAYSFKVEDWKNITHDAKDLVKKLIKKPVKERISASEALEHRWIKETAPAAPPANLNKNVMSNLKSFRSANKLKKVALHVVAQQISDEQIKELRDLFTSLDKDGNGQLTMNEMKEGFEKSGLSSQVVDLQQIIADIDGDGSGVIDYTEWIASTLNIKQYFHEDILWAAFKVFDRDGNGKISKEELSAFVVQDASVQEVLGVSSGLEVDEILTQVDVNKDGEIDFDEFVEMMRAGQKGK
jgi:calcium-dependent protein kinase